MDIKEVESVCVCVRERERVKEWLKVARIVKERKINGESKKKIKHDNQNERATMKKLVSFCKSDQSQQQQPIKTSKPENPIKDVKPK